MNPLADRVQRHAGFIAILDDPGVSLARLLALPADYLSYLFDPCD